MTSQEFVYWLNGFLELIGAKTLDEHQLKIVREHMSLVLAKVTPTSVPMSEEESRRVTAEHEDSLRQRDRTEEFLEAVRQARKLEQGGILDSLCHAPRYC
jgi:hypothetical protein